ncbi:hypothetical protein GCM10027294_43530 [Marinactinospora endophytica]
MATREVALDTAEGLLEFSHTGVVGDEYGGYTIVAIETRDKGHFEERRIIVRCDEDNSLWVLTAVEDDEESLLPPFPYGPVLRPVRTEERTATVYVDL